MRGQEFLDKMELIDPELIEAADQMPVKKTKKWAAWGALSACACMAVAALALWSPKDGKAHSTELTQETYEALAELGFQMNMPEHAEEISRSVFKTEDVSGLETVFVLDGLEWTYRVAAAPEVELTDISGIDGEYETTKAASVAWCEAKLYAADNGSGKMLWLDVVPGLVYSLSAEEGVTEELLIGTANEIFAPAQGDVQGDPLDEAEEMPVLPDTYEAIIHHHRNTAEAIGYVYTDYDSDGTKELFIGAEDMLLLEMYTLVDGVPKLVFASDESNQYYLCKALDDGSAVLFEHLIFAEGELREWESLGWFDGKMNVTQTLKLEEGIDKLAEDIMAASKASRIIPKYESF